MESGSNDSIDLERLMKGFQARLDSMGGSGVGTSGDIKGHLIDFLLKTYVYILCQDLQEQNDGHNMEEGEEVEVEVYVDALDDPNR